LERPGQFPQPGFCNSVIVCKAQVCNWLLQVSGAAAAQGKWRRNLTLHLRANSSRRRVAPNQRRSSRRPVQKHGMDGFLRPGANGANGRHPVAPHLRWPGGRGQGSRGPGAQPLGTRLRPSKIRNDAGFHDLCVSLLRPSTVAASRLRDGVSYTYM
jgi:hypothetical protein